MRRMLLLVPLLVGCYRDLGVPFCEREDNPCADAGTDSASDDAAIDSVVDAGETCECTPGETVAVTGACPGALEKKSKTCSASCTWGAEICALPKGWTAIADSPIEGRIFPSAVWTGGEVIVFGGGKSVDGGECFGDGAVYSILKNAWELLPPSGLSGGCRKSHSAVWTGTEMIVFGGQESGSFHGDGAIYDAYAKRWNALAASPLEARSGHAATWTGTSMLVWGGAGADSTRFADGALFNPSTHEWTMLPPAPLAGRTFPTVAWTETHVVIWGGIGVSGTQLDDGALYDPITSAWQPLPASATAARFLPTAGLADNRLYLFGGLDDPPRSDGAILSLGALPSWSPLPAPPPSLFEAASLPAGWVHSDRLYVWSGAVADGTSVKFQSAGASFDRSTGTWSALNSAGAPTARMAPVSLWAGTLAFVWSGAGRPGGGVLERLVSVRSARMIEGPWAASDLLSRG
jgi:hypothetical protein